MYSYDSYDSYHTYISFFLFQNPIFNSAAPNPLFNKYLQPKKNWHKFEEYNLDLVKLEIGSLVGNHQYDVEPTGTSNTDANFKITVPERPQSYPESPISRALLLPHTQAIKLEKFLNTNYNRSVVAVCILINILITL